MRPERLQDLVNHSDVLESRGVDHSSRVPKEVFCAKARGSGLRYKRASHRAWKHALPRAWSRMMGKKMWRTISEDWSRVNAAAWRWLTEGCGVRHGADAGEDVAPARLGDALLSCVLKRGLLVQRCTSANGGAEFFASLGHATWAALGWPLSRKSAGPDTAHFEFDPAGNAQWLHVVKLGEWQSVPFEVVRAEAGIVLRQTGDAEPILWAVLQTDHGLDFTDLLMLAEQYDARVDASNSRGDLLRALAMQFTEDRQRVEAIVEERAARRTPAASTLLEDPLFAAAYDDLAPDDQREFPEVEDARRRGRIRKHHEAFQVRRTRARATGTRAKAKAKSKGRRPRNAARDTPAEDVLPSDGPVPAARRQRCAGAATARPEVELGSVRASAEAASAAVTESPVAELPIGLVGYELSASNRAVCFLCEAPICKNAWRFDYRIKESSSLRDQRRIHQTCLGRLPSATRNSDVLKLKRWLGEAQEVDGAGAIVSMLTDAVSTVEGGGVAGPSGGGA